MSNRTSKILYSCGLLLCTLGIAILWFYGLKNPSPPLSLWGRVGASCFWLGWLLLVPFSDWRRMEAEEEEYEDEEEEEAIGVMEQPDPTGDGDDVTDLVLDDLEARREAGTEKYGTPLQTHNGRDALVDAYQEALDMALYLRQAIEESKAERDSAAENQKPTPPPPRIVRDGHIPEAPPSRTCVEQ